MKSEIIAQFDEFFMCKYDDFEDMTMDELLDFANSIGVGVFTFEKRPWGDIEVSLKMKKNEFIRLEFGRYSSHKNMGDKAGRRHISFNWCREGGDYSGCSCGCDTFDEVASRVMYYANK